MTKLSIIIPVYNVSSYLKACLKPLINSSQKDFELILIDDGSNDGSDKICAEFANKYDFIKFIHNKHQGVSVARNIGLKEAVGKWITFIDSDDLIINNYLDIILKLIEHDKYDIILYRLIRFTSEKDITPLKNKNYDSRKLSKISKEEAINYLTIEGIENTPVNKIYKRTLFTNITYPNNKYYEDIFTTYKIIDIAKRFLLYDDTLYFYRQRKNSIIHQENIKNRLEVLKNCLEARIEFTEYINKKGSLKAQKTNNYFLFGAYINLLKTLTINKDIDPNEYKYCLRYLNNYKLSVKKDGIKYFTLINMYKKFPNLFNFLCLLTSKKEKL